MPEAMSVLFIVVWISLCEQLSIAVTVVMFALCKSQDRPDRPVSDRGATPDQQDSRAQLALLDPSGLLGHSAHQELRAIPALLVSIHAH